MTVYERLFGTPERAARTIEAAELGSIDICSMVGVISDNSVIKCMNCLYEEDGYGCMDRGMPIDLWLNQEVVE